MSKLLPRIGQKAENSFVSALQIANGSIVCFECAVGEDLMLSTGESDTPQSCDRCGAFIASALTADGEEYVKARLASGEGNAEVLALWAQEWPHLKPQDTDGPSDSPFTEADAGCWYDSHRGYEGIAKEVIADAIRISVGMSMTGESGYMPSEDYDTDYENDETGESLHDDEERAENFLSALAPDGYYIGWNDGDFGMYPIEEDDY